MSGVHFIDGQYYVEVKRTANIGDYVTRDGMLRTVTAINEEIDCVEFDSYVDDENDWVCGWGTGSYKTLEPAEHEEPTVELDESQVSKQVFDLLANLALRVTSLERQLTDTQRNVERQAEELENAKHRISKHADRFGAVEEKVEMLTDDVITLDERSQILSAINKYYAEGSR